MSETVVDPTQGFGGRFAGEHSPAGFPLNASTFGAAAVFLMARSGAGSLYSLTGYNSGAATFVQVFNMSGGGQPASGASPVVIIQVPALSSFSLVYGITGRAFGQGITVASSSTASTYTATTAVCSFDLQHG